jgi:GAF domain-containing protein
MTPQPDGAGDTEHRLLQSIAAVARHAFGAAAASVFLIEPSTRELVFEAVSGEGDRHLVGTRFPPCTGIAGLVAASGQSMIVDDVHDEPGFLADAATLTGFVPRSILAAPVYGVGRCLGVLEVLDRSAQHGRETADIELLQLIADQAAIGLEMLLRLRAPGRDHRSARALRLLEAAEAALSAGDG